MQKEIKNMPLRTEELIDLNKTAFSNLIYSCIVKVLSENPSYQYDFRFRMDFHNSIHMVFLGHDNKVVDSVYVDLNFVKDKNEAEIKEKFCEIVQRHLLLLPKYRRFY